MDFAEKLGKELLGEAEELYSKRFDFLYKYLQAKKLLVQDLESGSIQIEVDDPQSEISIRARGLFLANLKMCSKTTEYNLFFESMESFADLLDAEGMPGYRKRLEDARSALDLLCGCLEEDSSPESPLAVFTSRLYPEFSAVRYQGEFDRFFGELLLDEDARAVESFLRTVKKAYIGLAAYPERCTRSNFMASCVEFTAQSAFLQKAEGAYKRAKEP